MKKMQLGKQIDRQSLKKIKGGMVTINGVQLRAAVKAHKVCSDSAPCSTGYTCYDNKCLADAGNFVG